MFGLKAVAKRRRSGVRCRAMAAEGNQKLQRNQDGILYVVATPIGHMGDITLRALETLKNAQCVAAEDTRKTGRLLARYGIKNRLVSFHEHNEETRTVELMRRLQSGLSVALVSNAGTPTLSDPGYRLVSAAVNAGIKIVPIPGASAMVAALSASGLPTDAFVFVGFLNRRKNRRRQELMRLAAENRTLVIYESPNRLPDLMQDIAEILGERRVVLSREMTKQHEEFLRGTVRAVAAVLEDKGEIKGECTLLVSGRSETEEAPRGDVRRFIREALTAGNPRLTELAKVVADRFAWSRQTAYREILAVKNEESSS